MTFRLIDMDRWKRKEYYERYLNEVVCTYSLTANLDVTSLEGKRLYPAMLWLLTDTVNEMPEFRTSLTPEGVGVYDTMNPSYTIFNKESESFSVIWTAFDSDDSVFFEGI
ncbi:MAG: CatA-like O-acetyltransferase [Candidatus Limiplasma sp.]|nr:CatA-like O-acetyltransferase [Candidatus Limiplasma sp.]